MTKPFYFQLENLTPGYTAEDLGSLYTEGACYELAVGFSDRYGWPVWLISDYSKTRYHSPNHDGASCHAMAQAGPDLFVDIYGGKPLKQYREDWRMPHVFELRAKTVKGMIRHFENTWYETAEIGPGSTTASVLDALHRQLPPTLRKKVS